VTAQNRKLTKSIKTRKTIKGITEDVTLVDELEVSTDSDEEDFKNRVHEQIIKAENLAQQADESIAAYKNNISMGVTKIAKHYGGLKLTNEQMHQN
jgi:ribosomal protein S10